MESQSEIAGLTPPLEQPLAERMRPHTLGQFIGQHKLLAEGAVLRTLIERGKLPSAIFWGDPGCGKTTLARIVAQHVEATLHEMSAVSSGVRTVRDVIEKAHAEQSSGRKTILFIDEIHRFNKAQQDALLHAVEDGTITLIGATTENPSFEVVGPLLSRCRVFRFAPLTADDIHAVITRALSDDDKMKELCVDLADESCDFLIRYSGGDARNALNALEISVEIALAEGGKPPLKIDGKLIERALMARPGRYDKKGEFHYDVISAFIKSLRGSDPDAALYWLARMVEAGEDPIFIARRMVILASEDIGNANPNALLMAQATADAVKFIGMPEGRIMLAQAATYLASSPKSNASYAGLGMATEDVKADPERPVPLHLRNAVTGLMKAQGYGKEYKYAHSYEGAHADQQHLPDELKDRIYYKPTNRGVEKTIAERLAHWWPEKHGKRHPEE